MVAFNGTSCSPWCAIHSQYNVSGVLRNAAGQYTVHFAAAMANVNYASSVTAYGTWGGSSFTQTTTSVDVFSINTSSRTGQDSLVQSVIIFGT